MSKLGVVVSLEIDEKNDKINLFGKQLSMHIAASNPIALNSEDIRESILEKERELISEGTQNSGKMMKLQKKLV